MKPPQTRVPVADRSRAKAGSIECDEGLFELLRKLRKDLADGRGVPPYVIFGDVALRQMARRYPRDEAAFLKIPGVGQRKLREFGAAFIEVIDEWLLENEPREFDSGGFTDPAPKMKSPKSRDGLSGTARTTLERFEAGRSIPEIAAERSLAETTIEGHLASCLEAGKILEPDRLVDEATVARVREATAEHGTEALRPIFEALGEEVSYGKIKMAVARINRESAG